MNALWGGMARSLAVVLTLVACPVLAQEPFPDVMIVIGPPLAVEGLEGLWAKMPVVVLATTDAASVPQLDEDGQQVVRLQSFTVEEVLKDEGGTLKAGSVVPVKHFGGTLVAAGRRYRTEPVGTMPEEREQVVLFLSGPTKRGVYFLPYGYFLLTLEHNVVMRGSTNSFVTLPEPRKWARGEFLEVLRRLRTPQ